MSEIQSTPADKHNTPAAQPAASGKRLAKNTFFLYIRMFVLLIVGLYTSRIVLESLGETDYGIYNIIGGVVVLFSFINQSLTVASQRFLNFHLGRLDYDKMTGVFCMSMNAYLILSAIVVVLGETVGLWFVNTQLNIPADRMYAANWVYQLTLLTFIISILRIPYHASIIAYEHMHFYAYLSLFEGLAKLGIAFLILYSTVDRLILYTALITLFTLITNILGQIYCARKFTTTKFKVMWDRDIFKGLFSFSGWSLFGTLANLAAQQGINIFINIFFGVTVNAAVGIANNVASHVRQFVSSFQTAFQPQIIKSYAAGDRRVFERLVFQSSKFSFFLIFLIGLPVILTINSLLKVWLTIIPEYTAIFCQLIVGFMFIEAMASPLWISVHATGDIKRHEIIMSFMIALNFPLVWLVFEMGMPVYLAWVIRIVVALLTLCVRFWYLKKYLSFRIGDFLRYLILPICLVALASIPLPLIVSPFIATGWLNLIVVGITAALCCGTSIYFIGLDKNERKSVKRIIITKILRRKVA